MIQIRISVQGKERLFTAFRKLAQSIQDYSPAWPALTQTFREAMRGQFDSQGARGGRKWAPLTPRYKKWKDAVAPGMPILVLTGRLENSLVGRSGDTIEDGRPLALTLGTVVPYARYHQSGTRKMVARPPIALTRKDYDQMTRDIYATSQEYGVEAGFRLRGRRLYRKG